MGKVNYAGGNSLLAVTPIDYPGVSVTPEVSGSAQAKQEFGDGTNELRYLRATINASDDTVAGTRLLAGYPDTTMLLAGNSYTFEADAPITRIDIVGIGDALGSAAVGTTLNEGGTQAEASARMQTFEFDAASSVTKVIVTVSQFYSAAAAVATATNFVMVHVEGRSDD